MRVAAIGECTQRSLYMSELPQKLIAACRLSHVSIELFILFYVSKQIDTSKWKKYLQKKRKKEPEPGQGPSALALCLENTLFDHPKVIC